MEKVIESECEEEEEGVSLVLGFALDWEGGGRKRWI